MLFVICREDTNTLLGITAERCPPSVRTFKIDRTMQHYPRGTHKVCGLAGSRTTWGPLKQGKTVAINADQECVRVLGRAPFLTPDVQSLTSHELCHRCTIWPVLESQP